MSIAALIFRSFIHYWKSNLLVILGAAISTMVLTGTLIVGDSMRYSLEQSTKLRLGKIEYIFTGNDRYFRSNIAGELQNELDIDVSALLLQRGIASSQGGKFKLNNIQVLGIDERFSTFTKYPELPLPQKNDAHISVNLANRLQLKTGDSFLLRIEKASLVPKNAPFVSNTDNYISLRLRVTELLTNDELGRFNLNISQTAPFNVFISNSMLNEKLEWSGKANTLLFSDGRSENQILTAIEKHWKLGDLSLSISSVNDSQNLEITSDRIFIDSTTTNKIRNVIPGAEEILTYMANDFRINGKSTPYSFISAGPFSNSLNDNGILINSWMANDLDAAVGDSIAVTYFDIGPLRKLVEKKHHFIIQEIVPIEGQFAERSLMPELPGLSDAGSCREWEAGVPISLDAIRDKDEEYWNYYRGTPKAFINYQTGKTLWQNRFGVCTAIRLPGKISDREEVEGRISQAISPTDLGFAINPVQEAGLQAAKGGVDFSQLFMGLSFFLLAAAIILMSLLFNLHLEKRIGEMGTLKAMGFRLRAIKKIFIADGLLIAFPGILLGLTLAIYYNKLVFLALNTVWYEIVLTSILNEAIVPLTLVFGGIGSFIIIGLSIWGNTFKRLKASTSELHKAQEQSASIKSQNRYKFITWIFLLLAPGLFIYDFTRPDSLNTGIYFTIGTLLLVGFILLSYVVLGKRRRSNEFNTNALISHNISRSRSRSLRIIILFTLGTFVTISTGLNKKDLYKNSDQPTSGTGGFQFYMETTLPVLNDLNNPETQELLAIESPMKFVQLRKNEGDDASCLNLNRVTSPRILGVQASQLQDRFSFTTQTKDLTMENPWLSLRNKLPGNVVPAILDQTVIQWGLGKKVGDTLVYRDELGHEMHLKIIAGLANSIFQGNVLIDQQMFLDHFPSSSGSHVFLVEGDNDKIGESKEIIERAFRNDGLELELSADRLAKFNQVENTYLSIFLLLGGLAMILGTIGLGISLARNLLDRGREIGVLRALGFQKSRIFSMITLEHLSLLFLGIMAGAASAFIATLPSILSGINQNSWKTALILVMAILINGLVWIMMISKSFLGRNLLTALRTE